MSIIYDFFKLARLDFVRLGLNNLPWTNALAYYNIRKLLTKTFYEICLGGQFYKLFYMRGSRIRLDFTKALRVLVGQHNDTQHIDIRHNDT